MPSERMTFFPKADAAFLSSKHRPPSPSARPTVTAPILDVKYADKSLSSWSAETVQAVYPAKQDNWEAAPIPDKTKCMQQCSLDRYLFPVLTRNERLRLTMLFYYTRGALEDQELMSRLQGKVHLARETVGWEFVIAGLLNHNTYTRMVTVGLPLAVLPRRESTCAHTVNQPPGTLFLLPNMAEDWRFQHSPHVEQGGLRAYAGVPLRFETEFGDHVVFGSLCVASNTPQEQLSKEQQRSLARLADWIVADIVQSAKARRQLTRRRMLEVLEEMQNHFGSSADMEDIIPNMLREIYPFAHISICKSSENEIRLEDGTTIKLSDLEHGLWEDGEYFDKYLEESNHLDLVAPKTVRAIANQCVSQRIPTYLTVGSDDLKLIFDDVDSWFVQMCANLLDRYWQARELREAVAAKETFLRGITHQLRTPIHGILGSVELLTEELKSRNIVPSSAESSASATPDVDQIDSYTYIKTIRSSARELITTVNSLIKLNQWADIAQSERAVALHNLNDITNMLLTEILASLPDDSTERPSIVVQHRFPHGCDTIAIDLRLLLDTVQPLVLNAVQASPHGTVLVTFSIGDESRTLIIDIEDNGRGIDPSNYQRIFGAYEKVDRSSTESGLGLTLACKSASLLGGRVELVQSKLGQGSHFRVTLPEQTCASSLPRRKTLRERLMQLPQTFHRISSSGTPGKPLMLEYQFTRYLTYEGYAESDTPDTSLLLLDYTSNLAQLYNQISAINARQAAICLVPESAAFLNFAGERITRQNNVLYVQGPFIPEVFEEVLVRADAILAELVPPVIDTGLCSIGSVGVDQPDEKTLAAAQCTEHPLELRSASYAPPHISQAQLVHSIRDLQLQIAPPLAPPIVPTASSNKPMTLIVDDNAVNLRLLEMYCNRRSIPYRSAKDGQQAVDLFIKSLSPPCKATTYSPLEQDQQQQPPYDLIFMDLQMPILDGIDATAQIRDLERKHGAKKSVLFIVTGQDSIKDRASAEQAGADGYLVKPVGPKVLDRWVKQWFPQADI